jgi:ABC-type lipoprotein export system ATPase subunit
MLLTLDSISKSYGNPEDASYRTVLKGIQLEVNQGDSIAIVGPSGSGKTTLLNIIGGLDYPDEGSVVFKGESLSEYSRKDLDNFRNQEIGFVFQFHHLLPQCTLMENVLIPTLPLKGNTDDTSAYASELLKRVGIWEHRDKLPGKMSGGECQRAAVVRAMINRPSLLLADEPTGALDGDNVDMLADLLISLNQEEHLAILLVTHSESLASRMDKRYILDNGTLTSGN